jgi:hypothetical protein
MFVTVADRSTYGSGILTKHFIKGLQGVTRMAYSPSLWLMAIGW